MKSHILLVDDEPLNVRPLEYLLRRHGYEVTCAFGGLEAWAIIEQRRPDLIITDWQMPDLDGRALSARVRDNAATRNIPIAVITTNDAGQPLDQLGQPFGIAEVIAKPFSPHQVLQLAKRLLAPPVTA
jgi:CheY-like chemotaxis protein